MTSSKPVVRCGIYTRKSTEEGLEQEFNSLMAQREAAEAYILSQKELGWTVVPNQYDDGGFSGGNMDRPALKRLLADVEAGNIDCVIVYKVDRLSRSLLDFAAIIGVLNSHHTSFVSVTQQFNSSNPMGRLTLNILLSFSEFERGLTQERTRDKVFAARRKGKWTGGHPTLGYDIAAGGGKLQVNEAEAKQVREIFSTFNRSGKLIETLETVDGKGWRTKSWITRKGGTYGGSRFNCHTLAYLLSNPIYIGKVRLKGELHEGEHPAIVDLEVWQRTAELLASGSRPKPAERNAQQAILRGLLFCQACETPMVPTYTKRNKTKVRYYTCRSAQMRGWKACPAKALPAPDVEAAVLGHLPQIDSSNSAEYLPQLIERISYDGLTRQVSMTVRPGNHLEPAPQAIVFQVPHKPNRHKPTQKTAGKLPRVARLMALAIRFEDLLRAGTAKDFADLSRLGRVTRARISQIMNLLNLAPDLQERLLFLEPVHTWRDEVSERILRSVVEEPCWAEQRRLFEEIVSTQKQLGTHSSLRSRAMRFRNSLPASLVSASSMAPAR